MEYIYIAESASAFGDEIDKLHCKMQTNLVDVCWYVLMCVDVI